MTNLDSILKSRDIILSTKVRLVKAMVFPVVMYGCESWTVKKAECRRIDAFELWCWRRLLRVPWTARKSNQSILKEINPGISLEGMMLKPKLQYFGHLSNPNCTVHHHPLSPLQPSLLISQTPLSHRASGPLHLLPRIPFSTFWWAHMLICFKSVLKHPLTIIKPDFSHPKHAMSLIFFVFCFTLATSFEQLTHWKRL